MNTARIVVLTIAVGAGGIAADLANGSDAEMLARARQTGALSLALRSSADINMVENRIDDQPPKRGETVNVVRYRVSNSTTTQK